METPTSYAALAIQTVQKELLGKCELVGLVFIQINWVWLIDREVSGMLMTKSS